MKPMMTSVLLLAAVAPAAADDPVARCRAAHGGDPAAHITCLEDALRAGAAGPAARSPAAPAPVATPATAGGAAANAAPAARAADVAAGPTGLGAEQAKARQKPLDAAPESVEVRIVSTGYNAAGLGVFRMADGQVWRETTPTPARHHLDPQREYAARIEKSRIGGYRLYVDGVRWMHKVERLQ